MGCSSWDRGCLCGAKGSASPHCLQLENSWQDLTSLADTNSGVLNLHGVNKSSSGLYRCQTLDLDDMRQMEKDVELVVNCKAGDGTLRTSWLVPRSSYSPFPGLHPSPRH